MTDTTYRAAWVESLETALRDFTLLPTDRLRDNLWDLLRQFQQSHRTGDLLSPTYRTVNE